MTNVFVYHPSFALFPPVMFLIWNKLISNFLCFFCVKNFFVRNMLVIWGQGHAASETLQIFHCLC